MKFRLENKLNHSIEYILRRAGYIRIFDKISQQESFARKLTTEHYPRFHLYVIENENEIIFDLHLDQAKSRHKGQTAHNADYETAEVENELTKIYHTVQKFISTKK